MVGPVQQQEYIFFFNTDSTTSISSNHVFDVSIRASIIHQLAALIDLSFLWLYFQTFCTKMFVAAIPICILFIFTLFVDINDTKAPGLGSFGNLSLIDLA